MVDNIPSAFDILEQSGIPSLKFTHHPIPGGPRQDLPVGTVFSGLMSEDLDVVQSRDFDTQEPETWPNGDPKMQPVAKILVPELVGAEGPDDDGIRAVYFKGSLLRAFQQEFKDKGSQKIGTGTRLTITFTGYKPSKTAGYNPQKLYTVKIGPEIVPPGQAQVYETLQGGQAAAQPQQVAQVPQQAYMPQPQMAAPAAVQAVPQQVAQAPAPAAYAQPVAAAPAPTVTPDAAASNVQAAAAAGFPAAGFPADALAAAVDSVRSVAQVGGVPVPEAIAMVAGRLAPNDAAAQQQLAAAVAQAGIA